MQDQWRTLLTQYGAQADNPNYSQGFSHFTHQPSSAADTYLVDLSHQSLLAIEGPDAVKFLQGQVTCDLRELASGELRLGAHCTPKGRMIASFQLLQTQADQLFLRLHASSKAALQTSLSKYIAFSKAKLRDASGDFIAIGLAGPQASAYLQEALGAVPPAIGHYLLTTQGHYLIQLDEQRFECWLKPEAAIGFWQELAKKCILAASDYWTQLNINAGLGEVRGETVETFTPQQLNFQLINGISFRKGCYTGQEIVARLHYRGQLKSHMRAVTFTQEASVPLPHPGDKLLGGEGKAWGEWVLLAPTHTETFQPSQQVAALLVMPDSVWLEADFSKASVKNLERHQLPYAIPSDNPDSLNLP